MKLILQTDRGRMRKGFSLACSLGIHGSVLAWVALWPIVQDRPASEYERDIKPNATRIVWYSLKQDLPPISPAPQPKDQRPPRALTRSPNQLVAGPQDLLKPPQLIWTPAPPVEQPRLVPSPNIVALAPPARPQPRAFVPPVEAPARPAAAALPAAPELTVAMANRTSPSSLLPPLAVARKTFIPPVEAARAPAETAVSLPAAPRLAEATPAAVLPTAMSRPLRAFTPPPERTSDPAAPPPSPVADAPQLAALGRMPDASLAIVGLYPARSPEIPAPSASQQAGFSAGPQLRPEGGDDAPQPGQLVVPGLLARSGAPSSPADRQSILTASLEPPTSLRNLTAAARSAKIADPDPPARTPQPGSDGAAVRANISDPPLLHHFDNRLVYSMALQMPNITSYSGSWIVWFAERGTAPWSPQPPPNMRPPLAVRKVDPKYVPAAAEDRIEGKVRLAAVIRKDGHVDTVEVLQGLDNRLDHSASEALALWVFEPAERNGAPIEVDAVFDIPFHLAPKAPKQRPSK